MIKVFNLLKKKICKNKKGMSLVFTVITSFVVLSLSISMVTMIMGNNEVTTQASQAAKVDYIARGGLEVAVLSLSKDNDWSDNGGVLYNNISYGGGTYTVTLSNNTTNNVLITSQGRIGANQKTVTQNLTALIEDGDFLTVDTSNATIPNGTPQNLIGIKLGNSSTTKNITIDKMIINWDTDSGELSEEININGVSRWNWTGIGTPVGKQPAGTILDLGSNVLLNSATSNVPIDYLSFNSSMIGKTFQIVFIMTDGSTKVVDVTPQTMQDQAALLQVVTSNATIGGGSNQILQNIRLTNLSSTSSITIDKITVFWVNPKGETVQGVSIKGTSVFAGSSANGNEINITDYTLSTSQSNLENTFTFNTDIRYKIFDITYKMIDATTKTVKIYFRPDINQSMSLSVSTANTVIGGAGNAWLNNTTISNTNPTNNLTIIAMKVSFNPNAGENLNKIWINGANKFTGAVGSAVTLDITDTVLTPPDDNIDLDIKFSADMSGKDFTIVFILSDDTTVTVYKNFGGGGGTDLASEDWESGGWAGGTGWAAAWVVSGTATVFPGNNPHAGTYHLNLKNVEYVQRKINLLGKTNIHLQFWWRADNWEAGDGAYCRISSDNGANWTIVKTWVNGEDDNVYHYLDIDLTPYSMTADFFIRFQMAGNQPNDVLWIDDIVITGN